MYGYRLRASTMTATTMTATNHDDQKHNLVKFVKRCREFGDLLKVRREFFTFALLLPSWYRPPTLCSEPGASHRSDRRKNNAAYSDRFAAKLGVREQRTRARPDVNERTNQPTNMTDHMTSLTRL